MRKVLAALGIMAATATGLTAQASGASANDRVVRAQPGKWEVPDCGLNKGNFMITSGAIYLKSGLETSDDVKQTKLYGDARRVLLEGIQKGQAGASGAWYYLGRAYLYLGDLAGADSALSRAQELAPACAKDIQLLRRNTWIPLLNAGIVFRQDNNPDSAAALFRQANQIYTGEANAYTNLGILFNSLGQTDSAIVYLEKAVASAGTDERAIETRDQSQYNLAALLSNSGRWPDAVAAWQKYLQWKPDDADAKRAYARALRASGQPDAAAVVEREMLSGGSATVSINDLMTAGVNFFRDANYAEAAKTFALVVAREPWYRDAHFNLANSYLGAQNGPELLKAALALNAIDPMNEKSLALLGQGYRIEKNQAMSLKVSTDLAALPFSLSVDQLVLQSGGATVTATATGRAAQTINEKPIPPREVTLIFEFLDQSMAVVASSERTVPKLAVGEAAVVEAEGLGAGIVGWRYRAK